jgi:hypothetical protein
MLLKQVKLNYDFSIFFTKPYESGERTCINHLAEELPEIYEPYGGLPKTYQYDNTIIYQLWWDETQVDFKEIGRQLGMEITTISSIMQPPGCTIPLHRDTFYLTKQKFPDRTDLRVRALIYLEDYKIGHITQYIAEGIGTTTNWRAGDGMLWDSELQHLGANVGLENKYTLQISGFYISQEYDRPKRY